MYTYITLYYIYDDISCTVLNGSGVQAELMLGILVY